MGLGKPKQAQWVEEIEQAMTAIWCLRANRIKQNRIAQIDLTINGKNQRDSDTNRTRSKEPGKGVEQLKDWQEAREVCDNRLRQLLFVYKHF